MPRGIQRGAIRETAIKTFTSTGNVTLVNEAGLVVKKGTGAATGVTLPPGVKGRRIWVKDGKGDAASNNITITPASGNVDGSATYVISANYGGVVLEHDGNQWYAIAKF